MFESLIAAAGDLIGVDPGALTDGELADGLIAIEHARATLDAASSRLLAAFDRREVHTLDGCVSAGTWLAWRGHMSGHAARQRVKVAHALPDLATVRTAFETGRVTFEHVRMLTSARTPATETAMARDETLLVSHAETLPTDAFARLVRHWRDLADADGPYHDTADRARRFVHLSATLDGTWILSGRLDAPSGAVVSDALERITDELWHAETRDAAMDPELSDPGLASQRRADALVELARRATAADPATTVTAKPLLTLVVRADDLTARHGGHTDRGALLPAQTTRRLACDTAIAAVITNTLGEPIDLGRSTRVPSPAQRRALAVRDGGCVFPGCDRPPGWCDAHHITHWIHGGPTNLHNLALLCNRHHHLVHEHHWHLARRPDHQLEFRRPDGTALGSPPGRTGIGA